MNRLTLLSITLFLSAALGLAACDDTAEGNNTNNTNNVNNTNNANNTNNVNNIECGNGVRDFGEECDLDDLNDQTCEGLGFVSGELACGDDCAYDLSGCVEACEDECVEGEGRCSGAIAEECVLGANGCLSYVTSEDCGDSGLECELQEGIASCVACVDACTEAEHQCSGDLLQVCAMGDEGCYVWELEQDCADLGYTCDSTGAEAACSDTCADVCTPNDYQCDGDLIEFCEVQSSGCYAWSLHEDCGATGLTCDDSSWPPSCTTCTDDCTVDGATRCSGDVIETCAVNAGGCFVWTYTDDCSFTSEVCDDHTGTAVCESSCTDLCSPTGSSQCNGDIIEECMIQSNGCRDWTLVDNCADYSQVCDDTSGSPVCSYNCTDECTNYYDYQCSGDTIEQCVEDFDGCYYWTLSDNCADYGQVCDDSSGTPLCSADCVHECATLYDTRCNVAVIEECNEDINGCRVWDVYDNCADWGQTCDDTSGTPQCVADCVSECVPGLYQCTGDDVDECQEDFDGCYYWFPYDYCADYGMTCEENMGTAYCVADCTDECSAAEFTCVGDELYGCEQDWDGCYYYTWFDNCADWGLQCIDSGSIDYCG